MRPNDFVGDERIAVAVSAHSRSFWIVCDLHPEWRMSARPEWCTRERGVCDQARHAVLSLPVRSRRLPNRVCLHRYWLHNALLHAGTALVVYPAR